MGKKFDKITLIAMLIGIFCLVLFLNSYFNYTSGIEMNNAGTTIGTRFFFSGPDPYYNLRLCQTTLQTGHYPFTTSIDPLLNYPVAVSGSARPPLFNMMAVASASFFQNFMPQMDALGWSMMFLPAIYGALVIFPVYGIGKELFGRKAGLIAALFIPLIPIHLSSGHGSAFALFDHDSFILLLTTCVIYFLIKSLKEKDFKKSLLFASFSGLCTAGIQMTWAVVQPIFLIIAIFAIVQLFIDMLKKQYNINTYIKIATIIGVGFFVSLPYNLAVHDLYNTVLYAFLISLGIVVIYYVVKKINLPWIISIPGLCAFGAVGIGILYLINQGFVSIPGPAKNIAEVIFGSGIYGQKVSLTIGEANVYSLSQTAMSLGMSLYFLALIGFCLYFVKIYKTKLQSYDIFFIIVFIINLWFTTKAGRFLNDLVPQIAILSAFVVMIILTKIDYKTLARKIKSTGSFIGLRKNVKLIHILGVLFVAFVLILPNAYCSLDVAIPSESKEKYFGKNYTAVWGNSLWEEMNWADVCYWLSQQDTEITQPENRPAIITWWDYGFYLASMSEHPTVADNYQDGIPPASNFLTAQNESEAIAVLTIRLVEGTRNPRLTGDVSNETANLFEKYFPLKTETISENKSVTTYQGQDMISILNDPKSAPSYNQLIAPEWGNTVLRINEQNAMYHDVTKIILTLPLDQIVSLYHDMMNVTGKSIRYVGIEYRDMASIYGVFPFLADKSTHGYVTAEDDFFRTYYVDTLTGQNYTVEQIRNMTQIEYESKNLQIRTISKDGYFNSFAFRTFFGMNLNDDALPDNPIPTYGLQHFTPVYLSSSIIVTEFYEGAHITGNVSIENIPFINSVVYLLDQYNIPHDFAVIGLNGTFSLIAPPGNVSLMLVKDGNLVKKFSDVLTVLKEEATWQIPSNHSVSLMVNKSSVIFTVEGVNESNLICNITGSTYQDTQVIKDLQNTQYYFTNMISDTYYIIVTNNTGSILYSKSIFVLPDENNFSIILGETNG